MTDDELIAALRSWAPHLGKDKYWVDQAADRLAALAGECERLRAFVHHYAGQGCSCGVLHGAVTCSPCVARAALSDDTDSPRVTLG